MFDGVLPLEHLRDQKWQMVPLVALIRRWQFLGATESELAVGVKLLAASFEADQPGTLPADMRELARFAGRRPREFARLRLQIVLDGWHRQPDGRLHHELVDQPVGITLAKKQKRLGRRGRGRIERRRGQAAGNMPGNIGGNITTPDLAFSGTYADLSTKKKVGVAPSELHLPSPLMTEESEAAARAPVEGTHAASAVDEPKPAKVELAEQEQRGESQPPPPTTAAPPMMGATGAAPAGADEPAGKPPIGAAVEPDQAARFAAIERGERQHAEEWLHAVLALDPTKRDSILAAARAWPPAEQWGWRRFAHRRALADDREPTEPMRAEMAAPGAAVTANRHPVDRLHDIKAEIAVLEAEHDAIRRALITGEVKPQGAEYQASIAERSRRVIPIPDAERVLPAPLFASLVHVIEQQHVTLHRIGEPEPKPARAAQPWRRYGRRSRRAGR